MSLAECSPLRRESATIAFVDVVESVRLMADAEDSAVRRIRELLAQASQHVTAAPGGHVVERRGDGLVLKFADTRVAVRCLAQLHQLAADEHGRHAGQPPLQLRAGLHRTELFSDDDAVYGAGVNLAARVAALGQPGDTLMSAAARDALLPPLDGLLQDLGPCWLKHVDEPVRLFRHRAEHPPLPQRLEQAISARLKLRPTLAVLCFEGQPFEGLLQIPGMPDLGLGLGDVATDQLIRRLSSSSVLHLISALSVQALRGRTIALTDLYKLLRADYVLRGRVLGAGGPGQQAVRVQAELWRRGSSEPVWFEEMAGSAADLLSTDGELIGRITHAASWHILAAEQRLVLSSQPLPNLASHTMYLAAVDLLHRFSAADFMRSRELLVELGDRAPQHAEPLAWLARWHVFRLVQGWSDNRQDDGDKALYYSQRALDRDPQSALALTMAGSVHVGVKRDASAAQHFYEQALASNPNDALAWLMSGVAQGFMNAGPPALAASEMALGLAPVEPTRHYYDALSATAALRGGDFERCIALAQRSITANGRHGTAYRSMAIALAELGRGHEAAAVVTQLMGVEPHFTVKTYLARVPLQDTHRDRYAQLLQEAGLPAG